MTEPLIKLEGITKVFLTDEVETHALAGIHLDIKKGEYVSVAGPSGCGKSTLLSILGLLDTPSDGSYLLNGHLVQGLSLSERARIRNQEIGFIFQSFNLIGDLTVYENVELPLTYRGMAVSERKQRVMESLEKVGMSHRAKHLPSQLSGGQQQRVAVARALAGHPAVLLADEPTGNLDSKNGDAVMELLHSLPSRWRDHPHGHTRCPLRPQRRPHRASLRRPDRRRAGGEQELTPPPMFSDLKYALRQLAKSPGFTTVAVLSLALGIGVNATMFFFVRSMVLQPLIRDRQQRLVALYTAGLGANRDFRFFSYPEFSALRDSHEVFSDVAAVGFSTKIVGRPGSLKRVLVGVVSENYFSLLHVRPLRGRFFSPEESRPTADVPVAIATYALWERLGRADDLVGRQIQINNQPYTVIGIAPAGGGNTSTVGPDVWLPLGMARQIWGDRNAQPDFLGARTYLLSLFGSFQPGVTFSTAASRLPVIDHRLNAPPAGDPSAPRELVLTPPPRFSLHDSQPSDENFIIPFAIIATALAATVLLVASLNLANMLLARGIARQKEIAIRLSLGATRWRIVRQLLTESVLLAMAGGVMGMLLSHGGGIYLQRMSIADFSAGRLDFGAPLPTTDLTYLGVIATMCLASAVVFGLGPALRLTRIDLVEDLKRQPGQPAEGGRWNRFFSPRHCRMMAQISLSFMLLFSAGRFVRGSREAANMNPGFEKTGGLVVNLDYVDPNLSDNAIARRQQAALNRVESLPGVASAALASAVPFNFDTDMRRIFVAGADTSALDPADQTTHTAPLGVFTSVSRGYFKTLGIPLLTGRDFTEAESTQYGGHQVAIIDETLAHALFGDKQPLGQHIATNAKNADGKHPDREIEIIGIIRSPREGVFEPAAPRRFYRPLGQYPSSNIYVHAKAADPATASALLDRLRLEIRTLDPDTPVLFAQPLGDFIDKNINLLVIRLAGIVFGASGVIALLLAVIGVYGVKAHAVVRRTREIGIRIALGAKPSDVLSLIVKQGILQTLVGLAAGMILALLAGRLLARMLYHVSSLDPVVLAGAAAILACTVLFACYLPARRATKVDPAVTLRAE